MRYRYFSGQVCRMSGMADAFPYIQVVRDGESKHTGGKTPAVLRFDDSFFRGRSVLLFDDVITRGTTLVTLQGRLESLGATVVGGVSIGRTRHERMPEGWAALLTGWCGIDGTDDGS